MNGRVSLLSALLALQLVIIAAVLLTEADFGEQAQGPFLAFEADTVDEIRVTGDDEDASALVLARAEEGWRLPDGLPADADKVNDVLGKLAGLRSPWPVATSTGAAARFEVADGGYQRHVVLLADGDAVADLYLGTSPSYQHVHARRADDTGVYSVGISNYQLPTEADQWLDKTLLQARGAISAVHRVGAWKLTRAEEQWQVDEAAADQEAAAALVQRLSELRVTGAAEAPKQAGEPAAVLAVTDDEGSYRLSIFGEPEGGQYRVSSDRREGYFGLAGYLAEQLLLDEQALLPTDPGEVPAADAEAEDDVPAGDEPGA
jgi:hypothetical protein